MKQWWKLTIIS